MQEQKINLNFRGYSGKGFDTKFAFIVESLTATPEFADVVPSLAVLQAASNRYTKAFKAAEDLSRRDIAEKNESRLDGEALLRQAGMFVMNKANGNVKLLILSGYTLTKLREPQYIDSPGTVKLTNGITEGELTSFVSKAKNSRAYLHEIAEEMPTEKTVWTSYPASTSKYTFTGLIPGKQYWVRVGVVGSRKQLAYSLVATQIIQIVG